MDPRLGAVAFMIGVGIAISVIAALAIRAGALTSAALLAAIVGGIYLYNR